VPIVLDRSVSRLTIIVYFIQGALGIVAIALPLYLKDLGFSISQIAYLTSLSSIPWFFKIIYGAISDSIPLWGLRRKPYLCICSLLSTVGWLFLALEPKSFPVILSLLFSINIGFAATDVITDGLIVEKSDKDTVRKYQSLAWGFRSLGAVCSGLLGGYLATRFSYNWVFVFTAILPLMTLIYSFSVNEDKAHTKNEVIWEPMWKSLCFLVKKEYILFSLLLIVLTMTSAFGTPYFFHLKDNIGLSKNILGLISSITWIGAIIGTFIFGKFLSRVPLIKIMLIGVVLNVAGTFSCFLVFNALSAGIIFFINGILSYIILLPILATAAKMSHDTGVEGCLFAVIMSIHNLGSILGGLIGGLLFPLIGLNMLITLSALFGLLAFPLLLKFKTIINLE